MARDSYRDLRVPEDTERPMRGDLGRLFYGFDAVADTTGPAGTSSPAPAT
ncbi:hypothetical protein [Streptomyces sp. NPDC006335]